MARNRIQFQKGLSEARFDELYGSEDGWREAVFGWRWPHGFVCPGCGGQNYCVINTALGNLKTAITATYRAIRQKHIPRYLAEFA